MPTPTAAPKWPPHCGTAAVADYRDLVDEVDAAIIATPTYTHRDVALEFLNRGLHVLVEKPLAASVREADDLVAAGRRRKRVLQVGHVERFNPAAGGRRAASDLAAVHRRHPRRLVHRPLDRHRRRARPDDSRHRPGAAPGRRPRSQRVCHGAGAVGPARGRGQRPARIRERLRGPSQRLAGPFRSGPAADAGLGGRGFCRNRLRHPQRAGGQLPARPCSGTRSTWPRCRFPSGRQLRDTLHENHLRSTELAVDRRNALADQHQDFLDSIRQGREPRVSGAHGRDALVVAERVLAAIQAHLWGERANRSTAPDAPPSVLRGPHWPILNQPLRGRRQAS